MTTDEDAVTTHHDERGLDVMAVIAIQVVVAVAVWGLLGLVVDLVLGSRPWVQFCGIVLGTMIALALTQRHATRVDAREPSHD